MMSSLRIKNLDVRILDIPTLLYLSLWIILLFIFWGQIPLALEFVVCHLVLLAIIVAWIVKPPQLPITRLARQYYAVAYLFIFFGFLNNLIPLINPGTIDPMLIKWDHWLFGVHPTVWLQSVHYPLFTEILQWSYLGYYFLPLMVPVGLHLAKKPEKVDEYLTIVFTAFYLFYFGNLIFPAYGPRFYLAHLHTEPLTGIWLADGVQHTLNNLEKIQLDAFPSGHATVIFILMYYTWKHVRKLFWLILPVCVALLISTVYLRLHYVVDIIAGLILTVFVIWMLRLILSRYPQKTSAV
jgi:membrane-associated phospholipid phosphatase